MPASSRIPGVLRARSLGLVAACGLAAGCGADAPAQAKNVLLISVDSLRLDHVGLHGRKNPHAPGQSTTPTFDALAARGVHFANARSTTSWTLPSHASLLTGLPDHLHGLVENRGRLHPDLTTLAELLGDAGFTTAGFWSGPNLHPTFGFGQGFENYVDCSQLGLERDLFADAAEADLGAYQSVHQGSHQAITTPAVLAGALEFVAGAVASGQPFFCFTHWWDPHYDYLPPAAYRAAWTDPTYAGPFIGVHQEEKRLPASPADVVHLRELYDAEIRATDDGIGQLLDDLDELGALAQTLVVYTADHGEEFYEHGRWGHQRTLEEEVVRIPMAMAGPGVPVGVEVTGRAQLQDVYPTVADLLGLEVPGYIDGRNLRELWADPDEPGRPAILALDVAHREIRLSALTDGHVRAELDHLTGQVTIHDLARPGRPGVTLENARPEQRFAADALLRELARMELARPNLPGGGERQSSQMSAELIEQLEALGYSIGEGEPENGDRDD
ncbi:sulfatase [Engelhardtia mirabilis]|uniref:Choline-sulfatase n=1 Tax=Engelhardtia mirabilis TaxID=2528011 RepID=A0A518BQ79_9BACT|nr:Choline-sulfatase [Planctomycetes bacterium Pla133]QDV03459.1 Choline-sulfatase [Planctomycetes bacterium Pla86]